MAHLDRSHEKRVEGGGDQRGRHPLARDVGDDDDVLAGLLASLHLVEIPGHRAGRLVRGEEGVAVDLREGIGQQRDLDLAGDRHLPLQGPAASRLFGERQVVDPQGRDRSQGHEQLQVLFGVAAHVDARAEDDHPEIGVLPEERRRHQAPHARAQDALGGGKAGVRLGVEDERGLALLRHLAFEASGNEEVPGGVGKPTACRSFQIPERGLEKDRPLLRAKVRESPVEDELEELLQRDRRRQRPVDLVEEAHPVAGLPLGRGHELRGRP